MKLLLIDDNRSLTTMLSRALKNLGYDTAAENDSHNALQAVRSFRPDLVVLDLDMPGKSGLEVYGELRLDPEFAELPVIMLAALSNPGAVNADVFGCDVISKPAKLELLHATIEKNLEDSMPARSEVELNPAPSNNQKREIYENILH